ncbi:hypothetical protein BDD12DRAFT_872430 [Trichophaea hybrida]|nr:hypothetical protein BDD12DRAFT_872430 [Trichophaea hybrida]
MATLPHPITELCTLRIKVPREEAVSQQIALIKSTLSSTPGFLGLHWSFQLEDPTILNWFIKWDSIASQEAHIASPAYGSFIAGVRSFCEPLAVRSKLEVPKAKVVEWATIYLKPETDKDEWVKGVEALKAVLEGAPIMENERAYVVLIGWDSKEAHLDWKKGLGEDDATKGMAMFRSSGVARVELSHVEVGGEVDNV